MKVAGFLIAAALSASSVAASSKLEVCSDSLNDLGIKDVSFPDMIVAGEKVSVHVTSEPNKYIGKGHFKVELFVEGIKVASENHELCAVGHCHLDAHQLVQSAFQLHVPENVPAGFTTTLKIVVNDHNGAQLSCVQVEGVDVNMNEVRANRDSNMLRISSEDLSLSVSELEFLFEKWAAEHGMTFDQHEIMDRMKIFADNLEQVALHNRKQDASYSLTMNHFAHLSLKEFSQTHFGFNGQANNATVDRSFYSMHVDCMKVGIPDEIDWTTKGAVTDVKNQGSCGSCWAFSTTGALEGAYFLKTGKLVSFSEQELVSCDHVDQGCNGGLMDNADRFIQKAGGLCTEEDYPYVSGGGRHAQCSKCSKVEGSAPKKITDVAHAEASLEEAVAKRPVSIAIEADQLAFQFYKKGVLTGSCGANLDHGVLAVGYGTLDGTKYWKVKNSWGPAWGLNGYILLQRGKSVRGGECGLLLSASYPEL